MIYQKVYSQCLLVVTCLSFIIIIIIMSANELGATDSVGLKLAIDYTVCERSVQDNSVHGKIVNGSLKYGKTVNRQLQQKKSNNFSDKKNKQALCDQCCKEKHYNKGVYVDTEAIVHRFRLGHNTKPAICQCTNNK